MKFTRARSLQAVAVAAVLALTVGCSSQPEPAAEPTTSPPVEATASESASPALEVPDPRSLTGPAQAASLGAIEPIESDPTVTLPTTVTDDQGTKVTVVSIDRIVTLDIYGTISQTLVGLGLADNIAGRTVSDTDAALENVPLVTGGAHSVNVEAVLEVQPTLVLLDTTLGPANVPVLLRDAGVDVVVLNPDRSTELIDEQIGAIAEAAGVPETGAALIERTAGELDEALAYIDQLTADLDQPLRMAVLYVRGTAGIFFLFGGESAASGLIADLGGEHVAAAVGMGETVPANAESLVTIDPEVFLMMHDGLESTGGIDGLTSRPGVAQTTAGINQRVITAPDAQLISFGPTYPAALKALADAIYLDAE
ncbi:ABC transporter substrate-binding protein [Agrococcus casei]|uniref:heme/hemin ABC transporter substrate-binding protein n=1 Tax=Agrococcus casei TaxID=343512 RepID=UPI003F8FB500